MLYELLRLQSYQQGVNKEKQAVTATKSTGGGTSLNKILSQQLPVNENRGLT